MATFKAIEMPLVRKIYPQLIANKIVNVQPLLGPTGLVHYLRHRYSTNSAVQSTAVDDLLDQGWIIKPKKKKIWRDISEPWESSDEQ